MIYFFAVSMAAGGVNRPETVINRCLSGLSKCNFWPNYGLGQLLFLTLRLFFSLNWLEKNIKIAL